MMSKVRVGAWAAAVIGIAYGAIVGIVRIMEQRALYIPGTDRTLAAPALTDR